MNSILVPAMLVAIIGSWLPAQIVHVAGTLTEVSCELDQATHFASQDRVARSCKAASAEDALAEAPAKGQTLAWMALWQNIDTL